MAWAGGPVTVIGGGIAGTEAAWQLATRGVPVRLLEMRPTRLSPAHHSDALAELVCSNSLKSDDPNTAAGALKHELAGLGSVVIAVARATRVPAGTALAVDRDAFSSMLTRLLSEHPLVDVERVEARDIPVAGPVIVATGPLTSESMESALTRLIGDARLHFFDAAAPVIDSETIDRSKVFAASRYGKGEGADYLNCPLSRDEYEHFIDALVDAQRVILKEFEGRELFQACQPVEEIARSGHDALRYGPLKPVGLIDPATGARPYAVVQLRPENRDGTAYNIVGFQTNLTFAEQRRIVRMLPGLEGAEIIRYGVMHRNTYVDAPRVLTTGFAVRSEPRIRLAGQLTGTEGYLEAASTGLLAALDIFAEARGVPVLDLPAETLLGALVRYATDPATQPYQPMHVNFGLVPPLAERVRGKRDRYAAYARRAADALAETLAARGDLDLPTSATWGTL